MGEVEGELVRKPTLWFWKGEFYRWNGQCYETVEPDTIRAQVYGFLDRALELNGSAVKPKPKNVNEVIDGLKAGINFEAADVPVWIGVKGRPEAKGLLACRNGLLEFETGRLWDHDPRFFGINSVDFEFDPRARCPRWERFLEEVWPGDEGAVGTLQEFFGLWLTDVTKYPESLCADRATEKWQRDNWPVVEGAAWQDELCCGELADLGDRLWNGALGWEEAGVGARCEA